MSDEPCIEIKTGVEVSFAANADYEETCEGPPVAVWAAMTEEERDTYLGEVAMDTLGNQVSAWAHADKAPPPDGWEKVECPGVKFASLAAEPHEMTLRHHCGRIECRLSFESPERFVAKLRQHEKACRA